MTLHKTKTTLEILKAFIVYTSVLECSWKYPLIKVIKAKKSPVSILLLVRDDAILIRQ